MQADVSSPAASQRRGDCPLPVPGSTPGVPGSTPGVPGSTPGAGTGPRLRCGIVLRSDAEDACQVLAGSEVVRVRYAPQFPAPRRERVRPGHLVAIAETADAAVVIWRWYDAVVIGADAESVQLWEPAHGEVSARRRRPNEHYAPGARAYLSAGLPGAEWWVAGRATARAEDADVELDEVDRLYTEHDLWSSAFGS